MCPSAVGSGSLAVFVPQPGRRCCPSPWIFAFQQIEHFQGGSVCVRTPTPAEFEISNRSNEPPAFHLLAMQYGLLNNLGLGCAKPLREVQADRVSVGQSYSCFGQLQFLAFSCARRNSETARSIRSHASLASRLICSFASLLATAERTGNAVSASAPILPKASAAPQRAP